MSTRPEVVEQNNPESLAEANATDLADLNGLKTEISLNDLETQIRSKVTTKDRVKEKLQTELKGVSFYSIEDEKLKLNVDEAVNYLSQFKGKEWPEFKSEVTDNQYYPIVLGVQVLLIALGQTDLKIDGLYGPETKAAVSNFQEKYNKKFENDEDKSSKLIHHDGVIGPQTIGALISEIDERKGKTEAVTETVDAPTESVEELEGTKYGEFSCEKLEGNKFNEQDIKNLDELKLTSVQDLQFFTNDTDLLNKYDENYFKDNCLAIKYFTVNSPDYYNPIKAGKQGDKIVVDYEYISPKLQYGTESQNGQCLYVECGKTGNVEWSGLGESNEEVDVNNIEVVENIETRITDLKNGLNNLGEWSDDGFSFKEGVKQDNKIEFDGETYSERTDGCNGLAYKVEDDKLVIGNFENGELSGVAVEYNNDGSLYYGNFENGVKNGAGIGIDNRGIFDYLYQNGEISLSQNIDTTNKSIEGDYVDIINTDMDRFADLISESNEHDYDLDDIRDELDKVKDELENLKDDADSKLWDTLVNINSDGDSISLNDVEYTKIDTLDNTVTKNGYYCDEDDGYFYIGNFKEGNKDGKFILVDDIGGIHISEYIEGKLISTELLRSNGDILVDEYEDGNRVSKKKLFDAEKEKEKEEINKIKTIKNELDGIITVNEDKTFNFTDEGNNVKINDITYGQIPADEVDTFTGTGYRLVEDSGSKSYIFGNYRNGSLDGEYIQLSDSGDLCIENQKDGTILGGIKYSRDGELRHFPYDDGDIIKESDDSGAENLSYSERMDKFNNEKEQLTTLKTTLDGFFEFGNDGKVKLRDGVGPEITIGDNTYVNGNDGSFTRGLCYKIFDKEDGTQFVNLGNFDEGSNKLLDGEVYGLSNENVWICDMVDGYRKTYKDLHESGEYDNEGHLLKKQEFLTDGSIQITEYNSLGYTDNLRTIEKPNSDSIDKNINNLYNFVSSTVEFDSEKSEFKVKNNESLDATETLGLGGKTYKKWENGLTGRAYLLSADYDGQKAFIAGDFKNGALDGNAIIYLADDSVLLGKFTKNRENGVFIEKQNGGGVYAHKYDNGIEISQELVGDTRMDKVQQSYMNKALASLLGGKEKVESVA